MATRIEIWKKGARYRCPDCADQTFDQLAKSGCPGCGMAPAPTQENINKALHIYAQEMAETNKGLRKKLDPTGGTTVITQEDRRQARDEWVEKHRKEDESVYDARVRWWKTQSDQVAASRPPKEPEKTVGEVTSAAIDKRARSWHLEGRFIDVNLPELRRRVRKSVPGLTDLERSTEPMSKFEKSKSEATRFVAEWS